MGTMRGGGMGMGMRAERQARTRAARVRQGGSAQEETRTEKGLAASMGTGCCRARDCWLRAWG